MRYDLSSRKILRLKWEFPYLARYLAIGVINTIVGFGTIFSLMYIGFNPFISNACGYAIGITVSYFLNKNLNFKSTRPHRIAYPRFIMSVLSAYAVNVTVLFVSYHIIGINKYLSQIIAGSFYVLIGFTGSRFIAFSDTKPTILPNMRKTLSANNEMIEQLTEKKP
jgi:putative flippase GtrA